MTIKELLNVFGIKNPTNNILNNPKILQILDYCNNNDADVYEHNIPIKEENFIILINNIHSIEILLKILKNTGNLLSINDYAKEMAIFYNLYNPDILQFSLDTIILIDEEYLKYSTKEWTENNFMNNDKVLSISDDKQITIKKNTIDKDSENYIESYLLNTVALKKAKELGILKEALNKLI